MNPLIEEIQGWAQLCTGKQRQFYRDMFEVAKPVEVVRAVDVLTPEQIEYLEHVIKPAPKQCYRNAYLLAEAFPEEIQYCECKVAIPFGIDHAINKVGESYIDITFEFALEDCPERYDYVVIGEWEFKDVRRIVRKTGMYGDIYARTYWESKQKTPAVH